MSEEYALPGGYVISTDKARLDRALIQHYLSEESYWAKGRPLEVTTESIAHSLCFGLFATDGGQIGFARVVTDYATFAWLCDVFVLEGHRGRGLGKLLLETVIAHSDLQGLKRFVLGTRDAHELYRDYGGFHALSHPERWMEREQQA